MTPLQTMYPRFSERRIMRHNFGLSPFPLTERRLSSTNKKRVETPFRSGAEESTDDLAPVTQDSADDSIGGDK
jgi:hypothetical protein